MAPVALALAFKIRELNYIIIIILLLLAAAHVICRDADVFRARKVLPKRFLNIVQLLVLLV
jgi:hypothetical protein